MRLNSHLWSVFIPLYSSFKSWFYSSKNVLSFSFDKVTTGAYNFVSVIWNSNPVGAVIAGIILTKNNFYTKLKSILFHN